jgi:isopropylmalate/homocitrate/citramalate synthase
MNQESDSPPTILNGPGHSPGKWLVNNLYWDATLRAARPKAPRAVRLIDSTLTEGDDCVGCQLNFNTRLEHMRWMDLIGVDEITLPNHHVPLSELVDLANAYRRAGLKTPLNSKGPRVDFPLRSDWRAEIRRTVESLGPATLSMPMMPPMEDQLIDFSGHLKKERVAEEIKEVVSFVKGLNVRTVPWFGDMRFPPATVGLFAKAAIEAGADGVYMVDSRGNCVPSVSRLFIEAIRETIGSDSDLYVQHHNSLGMATANTLSSVEGGANWVDVSILGIADRGGVAALEEVAVVLTVYGYSTGIKLDRLYDLGRFAQAAYGVRVVPWKPILGESWAMEEGWGHVGGAGGGVPGSPGSVQPRLGELTEDEELINGVAASLVGRKYRSAVGTSVLFADEPGELPLFLVELARALGFEGTNQQFQTILQRCRAALSTSYERRYLTSEEAIAICTGVLGSQPADSP